MPAFLEIIGHQKQINLLKKAAKNNKLPHALLFSGPKGVGKKTAAKELAKLIIGKEKIENHPDFIIVKPKSEKKEIYISQIRELNRRISLSSSLSFFKVAIIDSAHLMNQEAQNCFLKMLEEPKGNSIIILISEYPYLLLPTINSRVQSIKFNFVKEQEIKEFLLKNNLKEKEANEAAFFSFGRPSRAVDFLKNKNVLKEEKKNFSEFVSLMSSDLSVRFQSAKELENKNLEKILNNWVFYLRELLYLKIISKVDKTAGVGLLQPDLFVAKSKDISKKDISSIIEKYSFLKIKKIIESIQSINFLLLKTNINKRLALEVLFLEF